MQAPLQAIRCSAHQPREGAHRTAARLVSKEVSKAAQHVTHVAVRAPPRPSPSLKAKAPWLKPQATFRKRASPSFPEGCRSRRHGLASWPDAAQPCSRDPAETRPLRHEWERAGAHGLPWDKLRSRPSRGKRPRGKGSSSSRKRPRTCTTASDSALPS